MENSLIMIPSLEPDHKLLALVEKIRLHNQHLPILVVDDGSGAAYQSVFSALERSLVVRFRPIQRILEKAQLSKLLSLKC